MTISEALWVQMPEQLQTLFAVKESPEKDEVLEGFPEANSSRASGNPNNPRHGSKNRQATSYDWNPEQESHDYRDRGSAARFFFNAVDKGESMILSEHEYEQLPENLKSLFSQVPNPEREEILEGFPESKTNRIEKPVLCDEEANTWGGTFQRNRGPRGYNESGSAARFYYCAKASRKERNAGLETSVGEKEIGVGAGNSHPT